MLRHSFRVQCLAALLGAGVALPASATSIDLTLPPIGTTIGGVPVTEQFHDFQSYDANLLAAWQKAGLLGGNTSKFLFSTGTGTIAIIPYTGANGATNPAPFAAPLQAPSGNQAGCATPGIDFCGTWETLQNTGTVGALKTFLQTNFTNASTIPVFYFDNNQNVNKDLQAFGFVQILDPSGNIKGTFCFDTGTGGTCNSDTAHAVDVPGKITVPIQGQQVTIDNNNGSGKPDFFEVAPGLDLANFDPNDIIEININLIDLSGGFEELGIVGARFATVVPEPASGLALGTSLLALAWLARRRKRY